MYLIEYHNRRVGENLPFLLYFCGQNYTTMKCKDINPENIINQNTSKEELALQLKQIQWCKSCPNCLYTYLLLAAQRTDRELAGLFGEDLLEKESLKDCLDELVGFKKSPNHDYTLINRAHAAIQALFPLRADKLLMKHYTNEKIKQWEDDLYEDYYNMAP